VFEHGAVTAVRAPKTQQCAPERYRVRPRSWRLVRGDGASRGHRVNAEPAVAGTPKRPSAAALDERLRRLFGRSLRLLDRLGDRANPADRTTAIISEGPLLPS